MSKRGFKIAEHDEESSPALEVAQQRMASTAQARNPDRFAQSRAHVNDSPFARTPSSSARRPTTAGSEASAAPVEDFLDNVFNARSIYREERVGELAANIAVEGQITPVPACDMDTVRRLLAEAGNTKAAEVVRSAIADTKLPYMLLGGHYRKRSVARLGDRPLLFNLVEVKSLLQLYLKSYAENDEREAMSPLDDAMAWSNLLELGLVQSQEQIAEATGKPRTTIVKTLALLKLPEPVQAVFREKPENYTLTAGYLLTQIASHVVIDRLVALATQVVKEEIATRDLEAELARLTAGAPARKSRDLSRQHKILARDGSGTIGTIKDWDTGRLQLDVTLADPKEKAELLEHLKERFGVTADAAQLPLKG